MFLKTLWSTLSGQKSTGLSLLTRTFSSTAPVHSNTIYALSSGHGKCGVAVIRVSGPSCSEAVKRLCFMQTLPPPRLALLKRFIDPTSREIIDRGLVLWFPGPSSFTGEDCAEFQVHGGSAVVAAMLEALGAVPGLRPAEPGDFTKRAFLNGKMDLTEVEGLGDLIHAETAAQRRQAVRQMEGDLGTLYADWRQRILKCLANVEAFIDFSEDENIEEDTLEKATEAIKNVCQELENHLSDDRRGERLRDGVHVAIIGEPNVGKSSLLNALCQRPAAIVSPMAGTTRDVVETAVNLAGYPVLLSDTAGLRETSDLVEKEGVRRALDRAAQADLKVLVLDASSILPSKPIDLSWTAFVYSFMKTLGVDKRLGVGSQEQELPADVHNRPTCAISNQTTVYPASIRDTCGSYNSDTHLNRADLDISSEAAEMGNCSAETILNSSVNKTGSRRDSSDDLTAELAQGFKMYDSKTIHSSPVYISKDVIVVVNKRDLVLGDDEARLPTREDLGVDVCSLSCTTTDGLDDFITVLAERVKQLCGDPLAGSPSLTQSRHRTHLSQCLLHLQTYLEHNQCCDTVLAAQALRWAMRDLGRVTGAVNVEDVLDVIFKDFCIGK